MKRRQWSLAKITKECSSAPAVWIALEQLAAKKGTHVVTPTRDLLCKLSGLRAVKTITRALNALEAARWLDRAHFAARRANGERVGSLPYGHTLAADGVTLIPNDAEQRTIGAIRTMRAEGLSFTKIAAALTAQGIPTKSGNGKQWNQATIRGILKRQAEMEPTI